MSLKLSIIATVTIFVLLVTCSYCYDRNDRRIMERLKENPTHEPVIIRCMPTFSYVTVRYMQDGREKGPLLLNWSQYDSLLAVK